MVAGCFRARELVLVPMARRVQQRGEHLLGAPGQVGLRVGDCAAVWCSPMRAAGPVRGQRQRQRQREELQVRQMLQQQQRRSPSLLASEDVKRIRCKGFLIFLSVLVPVRDGSEQLA